MTTETGGDERDLLPLRDLLAPGSAVLAVRGTVLENGMPRSFRPHPGGHQIHPGALPKVRELLGA